MLGLSGAGCALQPGSVSAAGRQSRNQREHSQVFGSWAVAIIVMPYVAWKEMLQITPDLYIDPVVLTFLFICWLIVSALLYGTFKANAKKNV